MKANIKSSYPTNTTPAFTASNTQPWVYEDRICTFDTQVELLVCQKGSQAGVHSVNAEIQKKWNLY